MEIKNGYYRLSVKALIFDESRTKFLLVQADDKQWELPGGGLDWGEGPIDGIKREIFEEMGLKVTNVVNRPYYLITETRDSDNMWTANVVYETELESLDFRPSDECIAIKFVTKEEAENLSLFKATRKFLEVFNPKNHINGSFNLLNEEPNLYLLEDIKK